MIRVGNSRIVLKPKPKDIGTSDVTCLKDHHPEPPAFFGLGGGA
jgi:hypothetical protein